MMQAAPLITEELLDEDFFAELDALIDKDFEENKEIKGENRNCGTGAIGGKQGFQPGNKCAGDGSKSKAKAEGKKKDVHADWDDGKTSGEAGWYYRKGGEKVPGVEPSGFSTSRNRFVLKNAVDDEEVIVHMESGNGGGIHPRYLSFDVNGSQAVTGKGRGVAMKAVREVANRTVSLFQDDNVPGLIFTSDLDDGPGRAKLYKRMSEMLANKYDGISLVKPTSGGNLAFSVVKKSLWEEIKVKMADKEASGYKWKKSKDLPVKKINDFFKSDDALDFYDSDDVDEHWDQIPDNTGIQYRFMEVPDEVEKTYFFDELLNDESFMQEIERMFASIENRNCGTGAVGGKQGFQPGNKCAGDGSKSKAKAEGKKKDVHSDWDDGATAAEAGWTHAKSGRRNIPGVLKDRNTKNYFRVKDGRTIFDTFIYAANGFNKSRGKDDLDGEALRTLVFTVDGSTELQGWGSAMQIMREVSNRTISLYGDKNINGFYFDAATSEGGTVGRAKLYKSLAKRLVRRKGGKAYASVTVDGYVDFYVIKPGRRASGILETIKRNNGGKKLYDIDDFDVEKQLEDFGQVGSEGRSVSASYSSASENDLPKDFGLIEPLLEDEAFIAKVEKMLESDETRNCGTGAVGGKQGFQPGNKCAGDGSKSKAKAEGKKKDVHSDWDDGATVDRYWEQISNKKLYTTEFEVEDDEADEGYRTFGIQALRKRYGASKALAEINGLERSPVYSFMFDDDEGETEITGRGNAQRVFREVVNRGLSLFDEPNVGVVEFTAARSEPSRVKLYDFLSKFAQKRRKNLVAFADNNSSHHVKFFVTDKKYAEDLKEFYRFGDKPIYPVDTYDGEYGEL